MLTIRRGVAVLVLAPMLVISAWGQGGTESDFALRIAAAVGPLDEDVRMDPGMAGVYALILGREYGASQAEIHGALARGTTWAQIATLAYVQATTGRSFDEIDGAGANVTDYVLRMEMSHDKMVQSLEGFRAKAVEARNSRIFDRLRGTARVDTLLDLGAGFGLFQEALDLRELGPPDPVKLHTDGGFSAKGGTEN